MLLIIFLFWQGDRVADVCFVLGGRSVLLIGFLFWEGNLCCSLFFNLRGGSVLLIVIFCFGRGIRVAYPFLF